MSDDRQQTLQIVALGIEAEAFLASALGKYLIARAEDEIRFAVAGLCEVSPTNVDEIYRLQNQVWRAESIQHWIAEAIQDGAHAEQVYIADE